MWSYQQWQLLSHLVTFHQILGHWWRDHEIDNSLWSNLYISINLFHPINTQQRTESWMTHEFNSVCNLRHVSRKLSIPTYPIFTISVSILDHLAQESWANLEKKQVSFKAAERPWWKQISHQTGENRFGKSSTENSWRVGDMFSPRFLEGFHRFSPTPSPRCPATVTPQRTLAKAPSPLGMSVNFNCLAGLKTAEIEISKLRKFGRKMSCWGYMWGWTHWVFLLKMISTWGVKWGYHHLRKQPYSSGVLWKFPVGSMFGHDSSELRILFVGSLSFWAKGTLQ